MNANKKSSAANKQNWQSRLVTDCDCSDLFFRRIFVVVWLQQQQPWQIRIGSDVLHYLLQAERKYITGGQAAVLSGD
jgi:hypothetical protein